MNSRLTKRCFYWIVTLVLAGLCPLTAGTTAATQSTVIFLHTNDLHFDFNYRRQFTQIVDHFREHYDNVWLLDGGDFFVRHPHRWPTEDIAFYEQRGRFIIDAMNEAGYDAAVLGNHELDTKGDLTADLLRRASFPILGANVEVLIADEFITPDPYVVFETAEGETIAVIGITVGRSKAVRATNRNDALADHLHLAAEHDMLVALTHIGAGADKKLAERFGQLDVIIGGHSHTLLNPAETVNGVLIAQTGGHKHKVDPERPQHLGVVRITLEDGAIVEKSGKVLILDGSGKAYQALQRRYGGETGDRASTPPAMRISDKRLTAVQ